MSLSVGAHEVIVAKPGCSVQCAVCSLWIAITDQQIDALVYELYGLTEEEVRIVEGERK